MVDRFENDKIEAVILVISGIALVAGIVLLLLIGKYNAPSSDDWGYSIQTRAVWEDTHSVFNVVKEAVNTSKHFWNNWQGLYSSAFVLALMPNIFSQNAYFITAFITIAILLLGNTVFICTLGKLAGAGKVENCIVANILNYVTLQYMPSAVQGIYWYNGAMNYTFFYGLLMLVISSVFHYVCKPAGIKDIFRLLGLSLSGLIIAGGNHITAFLMLLFFFFFGLAGVLKKELRWFFLLIPFAVTLTGFLINVSSPGTRVRQEYFTNRPGVFGTIKLSIQKILEYMNNWFNFSFILLLIILIPVLFKVVVRFYEKTGYSFEYPLLFVIASVACLCLMLCPPYYAMGNAGAGRVTDVVFYVFVIFCALNEFYILGWLYANGMADPERFIMSFPLKLVSLLLLFFVSFYSLRDDSNFYKAFYDLRTGVAKQYGMETQKRYDMLREENVRDVVLEPYSVKPELLFFDDVKKDVEANNSLAAWYGKDSVKLRED